MSRLGKDMLLCFGHRERMNESGMIKQIYRENAVMERSTKVVLEYPVQTILVITKRNHEELQRAICQPARRVSAKRAALRRRRTTERSPPEMSESNQSCSKGHEAFPRHYRELQWKGINSSARWRRKGHCRRLRRGTSLSLVSL
ncbi:hypothetical protein EVAR_48549_1 [Eumeta japonica]|uniref:Uncharacterized protein n=1 Tax=Eumeta variegata TaxID=151549 RepID=A0A4C1YCH9_EUMVA|nr:hypothetical protein EVAR_48549_1 [Eumeta japonica]